MHPLGPSGPASLLKIKVFVFGIADLVLLSVIVMLED